MRALTWQGAGEVAVRDVPEPRILNDHDAIVKVRRSAVGGADLPLLAGQVPGATRGDVLGQEFVGDIVQTGPGVTRHAAGDRVVVSSVIACGACWYCRQGLFSVCDNGSSDPATTDYLYGATPGGQFGYPHAVGGFAGGHAEYVRVPYADVGAFTVPAQVDDEAAVFAADTVPAGWMAAEVGGVRPGDVVAVWGCGAVGQMAARSAMLLGADYVVAIDAVPERLAFTEEHIGCPTLDRTRADLPAELLERSGGRGPDVCIEAVGPPVASGRRPHARHPRRPPQRANAVHEAIRACRKGGSVFLLGGFDGDVDVPLGAVTHKGITVRGAHQHGQRYVPMLLQRIADGEFPTAALATHLCGLEDGAWAYSLFRHRQDGCVRAVFNPE